MPKEFYTERDIEDMFRSGMMSLEVHDNTVLTELAYEKARALGMKLVSDQPDHPPCAPIRPYILQRKAKSTEPARAPAVHDHPAGAPPAGVDLHQRIRDAVLARIGAQVDAGLLDVIIRRVLTGTGVK